MKIAVDAMGGDFAPEKIVEGAVLAAREFGTQVILVGREPEIRAELAKYQTKGLPISIHHASDIIGMSESPSKASRQKEDASIVVATKMVAQHEADAVVSAGNSGAVMTSALRYLGRIHGVYRPMITALIPTQKGHCVIADAGANSDCKPEYLVQFAIMAKLYSEMVLKVKNPKVGLLSIGEEKEKGNHLTKKTFPLLEACEHIHFIGNVEGRDVAKGKAEVVVCDGFVGNVLLKTMEGTADVIAKMMRAEISASAIAKIGYLLTSTALKNFKKKMDYAEYGGAPLLGVKGVSVICHGKSSGKAIKNAIKVAEKLAGNNVTEVIRHEIESGGHLASAQS